MPDPTLTSKVNEDRFEQVLADLLQAEERGERPDLSELLQTTPELETPLREFFRNRDGFDRLAPQLAPTATQPAVPGKPDVPPGTCFGSYAVLQEVGHGGRGVVYRVSDPELKRSLAVKVLRPELRGEPDAVRRFLQEAQVTGQLQHPGIVPVHAVGRLPDGRPYFAMKLVEGCTLAKLLAQRPAPTHDLTRFLGIFHQVCQAVAYAHSRSVIHRDLKPANVMVGAFGEVQVMDWGLAKVLTENRASREPHQGEPGLLAPASRDTIQTVGTEVTGLSSADGLVIGTILYMSPEQAKGQVEELDARADVFGLGAVLCEVLTGHPPYTGTTGLKLHLMAEAGNLADAFARLDRCGADAELIALAKDCLAAEREHRPRDAEAVAERVATYLAGVQERLRRAELERAASEARAEEARAKARAERRARRLTLGLAAALLLLIAAVGSGAWWIQKRQVKVDDASLGALTRAGVLRAEAKGSADGDPSKFREALNAALDAREMAIQAGASGEVKDRIEVLVSQLEQEVESADRNHRLQARLLDAHYPVEISSLSRADKNLVGHLSADEAFATAFRDWGLEVDATPTAQAAARLKDLPIAMLTEVAAALDDWAGERQRIRRRQAEWQRLMDLATALDENPDSQRRELRAILARGKLPEERTLGEVSHAILPLAALADVVPGEDRNRLRRLADQVDPATAPTLSIYSLTRALHHAGDDSKAEQLVRRAVIARPKETVYRMLLGDLLSDQHPPRWREALESLEAARALRPQYGVALAHILVKSGRLKEAAELLDQLVRERPESPMLHYLRGLAFSRQRRFPQAESAYHMALKLKPNFFEAYYQLAVDQREKGRREDAVSNCRKAIELAPEIAATHTTLGLLLYETDRTDEAIAELQKAIDLHTKSGVADKSWALAHNNLGMCFEKKKLLDKAAAEYHKAMELDPYLASAHNNLGILLAESGHPEKAEKHYRLAIQLDKNYATPHNNLGNLLAKKGLFVEAIAEFRAAIEIDSSYGTPHFGLAGVLRLKNLPDQALAEYRKAIALDPSLFQARCSLGILLKNQGLLDDAIEQFNKAIQTNPKYSIAHGGLANALSRKGLMNEALVEYRKAIELAPEDPIEHGNLGIHLVEMHHPDDAMIELHKALQLKHPEPEKMHRSLAIILHQKGQLSDAADECRKAITCKRESHLAYDLLGKVLKDKKLFKEAEEAYRQAIALQHNFAEAYLHLGMLLADQKKLKEAEDAYLQAIIHKPDFAEAHLTLAIHLAVQGNPKEAEKAFLQAIRHNSNYPEAHYSFGFYCDRQGRLKEAEDAYRQAIFLRSDYAEAYCNLGYVLRRQGRFAEALAASRRGDELGRKRPGWPYDSAQWVREAQRLANLDDMLSRVLKDESQFTKPGERLELADFCREHKHFHVAAVRFYRDAFAADPKLAEDPRTGHRCRAAQTAALAAAGQGADAKGLSDKERAGLRKQALDWLRTELTALGKLAKSNLPQVRQAIAQALEGYQQNAFAGFRDKIALDKLPEAERRDWEQLWADVDRLGTRVRQSK